MRGFFDRAKEMVVQITLLLLLLIAAYRLIRAEWRNLQHDSRPTAIEVAR